MHVAGGITVDDNDKIQLGDSSDLQIYHDATNNYIDSVTGNLYLRFNTVAALGKQLHIKYSGNSDALVVKSTAQLELSQYGSGTFTGTATYRLAVDTSGNVIEIPIGSGAVDGSGAANKLAHLSKAERGYCPQCGCHPVLFPAPRGILFQPGQHITKSRK